MRPTEDGTGESSKRRLVSRALGRAPRGAGRRQDPRSGYDFTTGIVNDGLVPVTKDEKGGYLNLEGRIAIPLIHDAVDTFHGGLAVVRKAEKWGYIDRRGQVVIPFQFDKAGPFGSGLAPVKLGGRTGFINRSGRFVFELGFDHAPGFLTGDEPGVLTADSDVSRFWTADGKFGYVNTAGKVIWGPADESPDHAPLFGWSERQQVESCQGVAEPIKAAINRLFPLRP